MRGQEMVHMAIRLDDDASTVGDTNRTAVAIVLNVAGGGMRPLHRLRGVARRLGNAAARHSPCDGLLFGVPITSLDARSANRASEEQPSQSKVPADA